MSALSRILPVVAGALAGGAIALAVSSSNSTSSSTTTTVVQSGRSAAIPASLGGHGRTVNQIYKQASPGVVDIIVSQNGSGGFDFPGFGTPQTQGEGAGVVYDTSGNILTDEHVVSGASAVKVRFANGRTARAHVVGTDPSTDVAVIRVNVPPAHLHPIPFADSSAAQVGDAVVAIGSPFSLPETVTQGIVSAVGRSIQAPNQYTIPGAIQTDAAINPGNSGGPLLDASGHVLGLNDQIQTNSGSSAGVGFAIPSNTVRRIADQLIAGHPVKHSYVGIELSSQSTGGALVSHVQPGSPGDRAGIHGGDIVTAMNGVRVTSTEQFIAKVDSYAPGTTITLTVKRGGSTQDIQVKLGTRPASPSSG